jgi:segregation and condensation protein A
LGVDFLSSGLFVLEENKHSFKLADFEGPLDLLLHLIKEAEIDIRQIFVSEVTRQYLEYISQIAEKDIDTYSDFIAMAATLLEIKAKKLLPKLEIVKDGEISDEEKLYRQLEEYKLFREAGAILKTKEVTTAFYREPEYGERDFRVELKGFSLDKLLIAYAKILFRAERREANLEAKEIRKERYSVANRLRFITNKILESGKASFFDLFEDNFSRVDIINTFLAVLELLKQQFIRAEQEDYNDDIILYKKDKAAETAEAV